MSEIPNLPFKRSPFFNVRSTSFKHTDKTTTDGTKLKAIFIIRSVILLEALVFFAVITETRNKILLKHHNVTMKYILHWNYIELYYSFSLNEGNQMFISKNCSHQNCFITTDRKYFGDLKTVPFDAILFSAINVFVRGVEKPFTRIERQKYVFVMREPDAYHSMCYLDFHDFFNWTYTYRLNADIVDSYITIHDKQGRVIGPKKEIYWIDEDELKKTVLDNTVKTKLKDKTKAVAWFVSSCHTISKREILAKKLESELEKFGLKQDVFGRCGSMDCPRNKMSECFEMIRRDYFFYLSFENSICEDYVTEKLLHALQNYAIPIVYGGANYSRFMPNGIYLDATKLHVTELASQMNDLIPNKEKYYEYFKWHNFYSYHSPEEHPDSDSICQLCHLVNDDEVMRQKSAYKNIQHWWNFGKDCK